MPLFITLSAGAGPDRARPILAVSDQRVIRALVEAISRLPEADHDEEAALGRQAGVPLRLIGQDGGDASPG